MDENTIDQFLSVLGKKSSEKPLASYTASVYQNPRPQKRETTFTAKDVISEVSKQIRAIQNADRVVSTKKASIVLNKYGQSTFLPVNILSRLNATGQNPSSSKFDMETQFATDTQLVNIAQDAEALAGTATGVTQEFETTFCQNIDDDEEDLNNQTNIQNLDFPMLDISLKAPNPNKTLHTLNPSNNHPKSEKNDEKSDQEEDIVFAQNVSSLEYLLVQQTAVKKEIVIPTDSCDDARGNEETDNTFTAKELDRNTPQPKDHQALIEYDNSISAEELKLDSEVPMPSSPVLNTKANKSTAEKSDAPPHLVFYLDMFEKFEKIASKIVGVGNLHVDTAKETGHSQIIKTEVYDSEEAQFQSNNLTNTYQQTEYSAFKSILERETDFTSEDKVLKASHDISLVHGDSHKKLVCTGQSTVAEDIVQERDKCVKRVQSPNHNVISTDNESQFYPSTCEDKADIKTENLSRISDEIIFSSDEDEVNYIHKSIQDLPLTCALETSFYNDQSKVLDKTMYIAFQTASNKSMQVLSDSYGKANLLDDFVENKKGPTLNQLVDICSSNKTSFEGPKATARSKKIFENIDKTDGDFDLKIQSEAVGYSVKRKSMFVQFQTASKKPLQISPKARTKKIFEIIDLIGDQLTPESFPGKKEPFPDFQGFRTASNNPVNISTEALAKSEKIFQDIELKSQTGTTSSRSTVTKTFQGFQTASNKPVNVSEEALAKSRKIFQNIDEIDVTGAVRGEPVIRKAHSATFQGFPTASNKPVNISKEALAKGRTIFQDIDSNQQISNISQRDTSVTSFQGFQTASNKPVNICTEALAKSEKIFHDIELKSQTGGTSSKSTVTKTFQGFQTASNKPVSVSEEALAKSKTIFQDFGLKTDTSDSSTKNSSARKTFPGFMTATNKPVIISEQAMAKSKKVFEEIEFCGQFSDNPAQKELEFGFKTANNNKISVSEEALTKSRRLLADIDREMIEESENDDTKATSCNRDTDHMINTQVLQNFEDTLHTEDFFKDVSSRTVPNQEMTPKTCKRSGSPILSLPKAKKRRKFEIPYIQKVVQHKDSITKEEVEVKTEKPICEIQFDENYKKNKTYTLKDLKTLEANNPSKEHATDPYLSNFDFDTLLDFEFFDKRNDLDQTRLTMQDLIKKFEDSVNTKLIPQGWVENHLKLILWKLISYEIKFPKALQHICTARNVVNQLKYRYDKELFNAERPALRKILEKDDVASKTLVLCVVAISGDANDNATSAAPQELVLTDGWYCIKASADKMLSQLIRAGNIRVGTKLATNGAELVGCEQGVSPWEETSAIRLKLSGNSTRRARWDARLGYHGNAAILSRLTAVRPDGGKVAKLRAFVSRVYPALYVEKFEDGSTVTRSERLELMHQSQHESERMALMEKLYEDVEKEFSDQDSPDSEPSERPCESGSQIARAMKQCRDPQEFKCHLTTSQQDLLDDHETRKQERYLQNVQKRIREKMEQLGLDAARNVVPLLKVRIAGVEEVGGRVEVTKAMLSVWKPSDAVRDIVKEGSWIEVLNVVPTAVRYSELHLSAGRQSIFSQSKQKAREKLKPYTETLKRTCYPIDHVNKPTEYNEIDTVGFICQIDPEIDKFDPNRDQFQNVYLADAEKNMICINFWGGLKKFGFETVLAAKQIVCCTNLQKRAGNTKKSIPQYRATEFTYFTKTPRNEVARRMIEEMGSKLAGIDKARFCQDCVNLKSKFLTVRLPSNAENISPYRFQNIDLNLPKNNIFVDSPLAQRPKTDENLNLTGLDFESSFKEADTEKLSPKTLLRKRQVKEKLQKLKMYGEPPPLSPFTILNKSKNAGSAYKSPLISKSDQNSRPLVTSPLGLSPSVARERDIAPNRGKTDNLESSPVLGMNRTYVKRINVNPVKLNFSNNIGNEDSMSESVDHFADDFDGSPPLSLD